jgi:hypothetical protein
VQDDSDAGVWTWHGACASSCEKMLAACPVVSANPLFRSAFMCNTAHLPALESGLCHVVAPRTISSNELGWGILGLFCVSMVALIGLAVLYEHLVVPWYARREAAGRKFTYKP